MSFISHISPYSQPFLVEISFRKQLSRKFFHSFLVISNQIGAMDILEPHADARFEITGMVVPSVENFSDDNPHF